LFFCLLLITYMTISLQYYSEESASADAEKRHDVPGKLKRLN
jgi:hypothetical protein